VHVIADGDEPPVIDGVALAAGDHAFADVAADHPSGVDRALVRGPHEAVRARVERPGHGAGN